jgi:hypothetical protein
MLSWKSSPSTSKVDLNEEDEDDIDVHLSHVTKRRDENLEQDGLEWAYDHSVVPRRKKTNHFTSVGKVSRPSKKHITLSKFCLK